MADPVNAQGIDVSHYQGAVDWNAVRQAGKAFAFAKATDGITYTDPQLAANWAGIKAAGLIRGAYHFFEPNDDAASQAEHFLATVELAPGDLPPVLDVERNTGVTSAQLWEGVAAWLQAVEARTGRLPMIYVAPGFWDGNFPDLSLVRYPLWLADYATQPTLPSGWPTWQFWQYSEKGAVEGLHGQFDLDEFNGTAEELLAFANRV
jgi:lysozyme